MKLRGRAVVIAGMLALSGALFGLAAVAASEARENRDKPAQAIRTTPEPVESTPAASSSSSPGGLAAPGGPPLDQNAPLTTYAGKVEGRGASIAIAVRNGQAIAYVCDGAKLEAWLQGPAGDGQLALTGKNGASVTGTHDGTVATGTAIVAGRTFKFTVKMVQAPNGLYRIADKVAEAAVNGGWIVADGEQTGTLTVNGVAGAAPPLDTVTGEVTVNGVVIKPPRAQPPA